MSSSYRSGRGILPPLRLPGVNPEKYKSSKDPPVVWNDPNASGPGADDGRGVAIPNYDPDRIPPGVDENPSSYKSSLDKEEEDLNSKFIKRNQFFIELGLGTVVALWGLALVGKIL